MSVTRVFGGHAFTYAHLKIREIKKLLGTGPGGAPVGLSVDGGVKVDLAKSCRTTGPPTLVAVSGGLRRRPSPTPRRRMKDAPLSVPPRTRNSWTSSDTLSASRALLPLLQQTSAADVSHDDRAWRTAGPEGRAARLNQVIYVVEGEALVRIRRQGAERARRRRGS